MNNIQLFHLLTKPNEEREQKSINDLQNLCTIANNIDYVQIVNEPYTEEPPRDNVLFGRSDWVVGKTKPFSSFGLISGHYGCYLAHINAIKKFFKQDSHDYLIIAECDCKIDQNYKVLSEKINLACKVLNDTDYKIFSLVNPNSQSVYNKNLLDNIFEVNIILCTHLYIIHKKQKLFYQKIISNYGWHAMDWWLNLVFIEEKEGMLCYKDIQLTSQYQGPSQIDRI